MHNSGRSLRSVIGMFLILCAVLGCVPAHTETTAHGRRHDPPTKQPKASYAVVNVAPHDVLNVRTKPDAAARMVGRIPSHGLGIHIAGGLTQTPAEGWVLIRYKELTGWVNSRYLAPQIGSCNDAVAARAGQVMWTLKQKDLATLAELAHPDKGVRFSPYAYVRHEDLVFRATDIKKLLPDQAIRTWGYFDGTGLPITLTFAAYFKRFIYDADFARPQVVGCDTVIGKGNSINNIREVYPEAVFVEYHFKGRDAQLGGLDWRSLRLVLEEQQGVWYLVGIVHDEWTI